jgi:hypothetical protein
MKMKSILIVLATVILSCDVYALEFQKSQGIPMADQVPSSVNYLLNQDTTRNILQTNNIVESHTTSLASVENPDEFVTAITVYLIIILVYSIYGLKVSYDDSETGN